MNLDLLYSIPLAFGNDIVPKYIHFAFAILTTWLIFDYIKKRLTINYALFGATFFLSLPIIVKLSITVYVDLGVVYFSTSSLLMLFKWAEHNKLRHLVFAGIFCGLAAGTKYNGLVSIFLLTALTPIIYIRLGKSGNESKPMQVILLGSLFLIITLLTFSPWMVRNYKATGNPIYPLYNSLFKQTSITYTNSTTDTTNRPHFSTTQDITKTVTIRGSSVLANRKVLYHETWWQMILLPVRFFFEGQDDDPQYFDGKLNPFLLMLMFLALYKPDYPSRIKRELYILFAFGWLFFFFTFFQGTLRIRYIASSVPAFVILATFGIHNFQTKLQSSQKDNSKIYLAIVLLVSVTLAYNANYSINLFKQLKPLSFITGNVPREDYISKHLPEYPIIKFANENLGEETKILALYGGNRGYYYDHTVTFEPDGNTFRLGAITNNSTTPSEISNKLQELGFTHLVIRLKLFTEMANNNLDPEKIVLLNEFLIKNTDQLVRNEKYGLFQLK
ncbi:glycosyltransferase family 39 protein [Desulfopila sp. IMCC35008]|uniref:ArnT family glycosyltransferase n=1 Tax=Desulfopila sp. IMCC35008 TaxID=2653858 RepID=UPI0013D7B61C|nr:glycosyltransferase family 39 protein [Desulfopila sp. IMCC35008]